MKLQREYFSAEKDGFFGAYFPNTNATDRCMITIFSGFALLNVLGLEGWIGLTALFACIGLMAVARAGLRYGEQACSHFIIAIALSTDDDIIILDPEGEYTPLVKALGGSVIRYAVGGSDWVNAMDMENGYGEGSPVAFKSQFIMSLLKQVDPDGIGAHQKSIIDRCVAQVFREQKLTGEVPTLCTVREKLLKQPEPEARGLALTMELYTSGSLDIFAHETNVDTQNRITSHDIHALSEDLKQPGFVTITDAMLNRVNRNWAQGRKTHVFIDEFHIA